MKKGFTLVELLAVIVILGIVGLIAVPVVTSAINDARDRAYDTTVAEIKSAAYDWSLLHPNLLPKNNNESIIVYLGDLKIDCNIDKNIKNPKTAKLLSNNSSVTITYKDGTYIFENVTLIDIDNKEVEDAPVLVIAGDLVDYVEVNQDNIAYDVPSAVAKNKNGIVIDNSHISYVIMKDNEVVSSVDTSKIGKYKIIYTVTDDGISANYEKMVIVRDTTAPEIDVGENINCTTNTIPDDFMAGVTITDNSGEELVPTIRSTVSSIVGTYYVYYDVTDSSGNTTTKRRKVVVGEVVANTLPGIFQGGQFLDEYSFVGVSGNAHQVVSNGNLAFGAYISTNSGNGTMRTNKPINFNGVNTLTFTNCSVGGMYTKATPNDYYITYKTTMKLGLADNPNGTNITWYHSGDSGTTGLNLGNLNVDVSSLGDGYYIYVYVTEYYNPMWTPGYINGFTIGSILLQS